MTTITLPRAVVEQALEALWQGVKLLNYRGGTVECLPLHDAITALRAALAQQAEPVLQGPVRIKPGSYTLGATWVGGGGGSGGVGAPPQQPEPVADPFNCPKCGRHDYGMHGACPTCDAQQAEPVDTDCHTQGICQRSGYGIGQQAEPVTSCGWLFRRNADGTIGIFAPPPKPGESQRTSDCVGPNNHDLHELLGKLADHMAALAQQAEPVEPVAVVRSVVGQGDKGVRIKWLSGFPQIGDRLYATPQPQRKPLTEEEIVEAVREADLDWQAGWTLDEHEPNRFITLARAVERAHGIGEEK